MKKLLLLLAVVGMTVACQKEDPIDTQSLDLPAEVAVTFGDLDALIAEAKIDDSSLTSKAVQVSPENFDLSIQQITYQKSDKSVGTIVGTNIEYVIVDCEDVDIRTELIYGYARDVVQGFDYVSVDRVTFGKVETISGEIVNAADSRAEIEEAIHGLIDNAPAIPKGVEINPEGYCTDFYETVLGQIDSDFKEFSGGIPLGIQSLEDATYSTQKNYYQTKSGDQAYVLDYIAEFETKFDGITIKVVNSSVAPNQLYLNINGEEKLTFANVADLSLDNGDFNYSIISDVWKKNQLGLDLKLINIDVDLSGTTYNFVGIDWIISDEPYHNGVGGHTYRFSSGTDVVFFISRNITGSNGVLDFGDASIWDRTGQVDTVNGTLSLRLQLSALTGVTYNFAGVEWNYVALRHGNYRLIHGDYMMFFNIDDIQADENGRILFHFVYVEFPLNGEISDETLIGDPVHVTTSLENDLRTLLGN